MKSHFAIVSNTKRKITQSRGGVSVGAVGAIAPTVSEEISIGA